MHRKTTYLSAIALLAVAIFLPGANAQTAADALPAEVLACADEVDVMRRLSCYDREIAALKAAQVAEAPATAAGIAEESIAEVPQAPAQPVKIATEAAPEVPEAPSAPVIVTAAPAPDPEPGSRGPAAAPAAVATATVAADAVPAPQAAAASAAAPPVAPADDDFGLKEGPKQLTARVVNIRRRPYGEMVILLDNDQIWEQKHVDRRFKLEIGDEVTITKGLVSGYRLSGRSNNSIQVERRK